MFGDERLEELLKSIIPEPEVTARAVLVTLEDACRVWVRGADLEDDLTLLVMRVNGGTTEVAG